MALKAGMNTGLEGTHRKHDTRIFEKKFLQNGIPVWLQKKTVLLDEEGCLIAFLPNVGGRIDPEDGSGTSHFFEHILYSGTKSYPTTKEIVDPIEEIGGDITQARTGIDRTVFPVSAPVQFSERAIRVLYDMIANPLIREKDVVHERKIILDEYRNLAGDPRRLVNKYFFKSFFGKHPLGRQVIGTPKVIRSMTSERLWKFFRAHYHAGNIQLICGGTFAAQKNIFAFLDSTFGILREGAKADIASSAPLPFGDRRKAAVFDKHFTGDEICLVYPMTPRDFRTQKLMLFFSHMIAAGLASPLMTELRKKRGWCYSSLRHAITAFSDIWYYFIAFPVSHAHFDATIGIYRKVLELVSPDDIVRFQKRRQYGRLKTFSNPLAACDKAMEHVLFYGKVFSHREAEAMEDSFTVEEILSVRNSLLEITPFTFLAQKKE